MDSQISPITTIPGICYSMGAMIIYEIGDFSCFSSPDKVLAYAGLSPSTYKSGKLDNCYSYAEYLAKKCSEGKHYYVAIFHAVKKIVRVIFHLERTGHKFI